MDGEHSGVGPDPKLADKSAEDVGAMLEALVHTPEPEPPPDPPAPEPAPETPPPAAPAPVTEPPPNGAPVPDAPAESPPPTIEEQLEAMRHDREIDALERAKLNEEIRLERLLREQANTRTGALKKVASDLLREGREVPGDESIYQDEARPESRELGEIRREIGRLKEVEVQRAIHDAGGRFAAENPEYGDYVQDMQPHITRRRQEYSSYLDSGDPRLVAETTRLILRTALIDAKAERINQKREEAKAKRAEQFAALHKQKAAVATTTATASGAAPAVQPPPKTRQNMTADDAGAALDRMLR